MKLDRIARHGREAANAFRVAPVEVLTTAAIAAMFSWSVEQPADAGMVAWAELTAVWTLSGIVAWIATLLYEAGWPSRWRWALTFAGVAIAALALGIALDFEQVADLWRAAPLLAAAVLCVTLVPLLARATSPVQRTAPDDGSGDTLMRALGAFNARHWTRVVGATLYGAALFLGLALAIASVGELFDLEVRDEIFAHVFGWIGFALVPWIIVGGAPALAPPWRSGAAEAIVVRFARYLLIPLLAIYFAILYAYAVRILVLSELPKNILSPLVIVAGALAALGAITLGAAGDVSRRLARFAVPLYLPLGALGIWAVWLRIDQYGWTEFRYLRMAVLVAFFVLAIAGTVEIAARRTMRVYWIPLVLAGMLILSAVGPWSAAAVSRRSQQARLVQALGEVGIPVNERNALRPIDRPRRVPAEAYEEVNAVATYLVRHFGADAIEPLVPVGDVATLTPWPGSPLDLAGWLGLEPDALVGRARFVTAESSGPIPLTGIGDVALYPIRVPASPDAHAAGGAIARIASDSTRLLIGVAGERLEADIAPILEWVAAPDPALIDEPGTSRSPRVRLRPPDAPRALPPELAVLPLSDTTGATRGRVLIRHIRVYLGEGPARPQHVEGLLIMEQR
ncbi:MAG: DUF4153 domain-containing protein [Longimicrobiales bacterium]